MRAAQQPHQRHLQLATDQKRNRTELVGERVRQVKGLADRQIEKASVEGQSRWPKPTGAPSGISPRGSTAQAWF